MSTARYVVISLLLLVPTLILVTTVNFVILHIAPGDPAIMLAGPQATPDEVAHIRAELGLDAPLWRQLALYYARVIQFDFGTSVTFNRPVFELLIPRLNNTLILTGTALLVSVLLGTVLGVLAARRPGGAFDQLLVLSSVFFYSIPTFLLGVITILLFGVAWRALPVQGMLSLGIEWGDPRYFPDLARHMVLPVTALALPTAALFARMTRGSMLEVVRQDYITLARSKGCTERSVYFRHALPNALLAVVTLLGLSIRNLLMGSAVVETVFAWPGLGRMMYESVQLRDYNILMGGFILFSLVQILTSILTDIVYTIIDPRIRY